MMKRVSSRARLVSWDAFDATAVHSDSDESDYETCVSRVTSYDSDAKRKRKQVIENYEDSECYKNVFTLLSDDLCVNVASFLTHSDVRNVMQVNRRFRSTIHTSRYLFEKCCQQEWPFLQEWSHIQLPLHNKWSHLALAVTKPSSAVDESIFRSDVATTRTLTLRHGRLMALKNELVLRKDKLVQFTGKIGVGDRCIRANYPLPTPKLIPTRRFFRETRRYKARPFVAPMIGSDGVVSLEPRLFSYFEITIQNGKDEEHDGERSYSSATECVAVGLATSSFAVHSRMPGWDRQSYGYHGDDGGVFHGAGTMRRRFGPVFGVGDTVGCGIDYSTRSIFYTLNGEMLGTAFEGVDLQESWYPVVGMDTHALIGCNFTGPFRYDVGEMMREQADFVAHALRKC